MRYSLVVFAILVTKRYSRIRSRLGHSAINAIRRDCTSEREESRRGSRMYMHFLNDCPLASCNAIFFTRQLRFVSILRNTADRVISFIYFLFLSEGQSERTCTVHRTGNRIERPTMLSGSLIFIYGSRETACRYIWNIETMRVHTHTHVRDLRVRFKAERDIAFALHCYRYVAYCPFHRHSGSRKAALQSKALSFASRNTRYSCRNVVISARKSRLARLYTEVS